MIFFTDSALSDEDKVNTTSCPDAFSLSLSYICETPQMPTTLMEPTSPELMTTTPHPMMTTPTTAVPISAGNIIATYY